MLHPRPRDCQALSFKGALNYFLGVPINDYPVMIRHYLAVQLAGVVEGPQRIMAVRNTL